MDDPKGAAAYQGDTAVFDEIGASLPDEDTSPAPATVEGAETAPETVAPEPQARDEHGRFAEKDAAAPPDAAASQEAAAATEPPAAPPSPADQPPAAPDLSEYPAYEYRVNGQNVPLAGAIRGSDGVLIRNESLPQLERLLAEAHQAHQARSQSGRQVAELRAQVKAAQDEKNTVLGKMAEIMADPAKFDAWAENTQGNWEKLVLEARLKIAEQERDSRANQYDEVVTEQQVQALIPQLHAATEGMVGQLAADPEFKDLGLDADWQREFKTRLMETHFDRLFTEGTAEDVAAGIVREVGDTVFHPDVIQAEMRYHAGFARKELARQKALADADARNRRTAPPAASVPTPGAKPLGSPAAKPKPALKDGMSREDVDKLVFETMMEE